MRTVDEILAEANDTPAFSNGTEGHAWEVNWCDQCVHDAPFRNMGKGTGCPILSVALLGKTPSEWFEQPWGEHGPRLGDQYHCIEFRPPGGGGDGEPRPRPEPRGMDGLFERPERGTRMFVQPELEGVHR